jgi:hypothetical protein
MQNLVFLGSSFNLIIEEALYSQFIYLNFQMTYIYQSCQQRQSHQHKKRRKHKKHSTPADIERTRERIRDFLQKHINRRRTITYLSLVRAENVNPQNPKNYVNYLNEELMIMGYSNDFVAYRKKHKYLRGYSIKIKPKNAYYKKRILNKIDKGWRRVHYHFGDHISRTRGQRVVVKECNDKNLANWYKSIISVSPLFEDYVVSVYNTLSSIGNMTIDTLGTTYKVVIECDVNINININC